MVFIIRLRINSCFTKRNRNKLLPFFRFIINITAYFPKFWKQPIGAVLYKSRSDLCFWKWIWEILDRPASVDKKSYSIESGSTLTKLGALLKVCHFSRYAEVFWILIERLNSEYSQKVRYSGKYLLISLGYGGISLWYLLASWEDFGVVFYL